MPNHSEEVMQVIGIDGGTVADDIQLTLVPHEDGEVCLCVSSCAVCSTAAAAAAAMAMSTHSLVRRARKCLDRLPISKFSVKVVK